MADNKEAANEKPAGVESVTTARDIPVSKPLVFKNHSQALPDSKAAVNEKPMADESLSVAADITRSKPFEIKSPPEIGGLLYVLEMIGAGFLCLLIGDSAWKAHNYGLALGGWIAGTAVGLVLYLWIARSLDPFVCFLVIPGVGLLVALILHQIHKSIPN